MSKDDDTSVALGKLRFAPPYSAVPYTEVEGCKPLFEATISWGSVTLIEHKASEPLEPEISVECNR